MSNFSKDKIVGVVGAGTMGSGIAQVAAKAGHQVLLFDVMEGAAERGKNGVAKGLEKLVSRQKMTEADKDGLLANIRCVAELEDLKECALVIEVIIEKLEIKKDLFAKLEDICSDDVILATNTSSISVTSIAKDLKRPERLVGMHFFNPAPIMKLVEVVSGLVTAKEVAETIYELATSWGKHAVYAKSTPGFIVNRVARPFYAEALRVYEEGGAEIALIDAALKQSGGFRMGPFELMDLIGHDVNYAVTNSVYAAYYNDQRFLPSLVQKELIEAGRLGRKSGAGFYDYSDDAAPVVVSSEAAVEREFNEVEIKGDTTAFASLISLIEESDVSVKPSVDGGDVASVKVGSATLQLSNGTFATVAAKDQGIDDLIFFDLALDYKAASRVLLAKADQASKEALKDAIAFFQKLGKDVSVMEDVAGMIVMRTVAMLANEGADAVYQNVCTVGDVDIAMKGGVNYPKGPMEWADQVGLPVITQVLNGLFETYGMDRYRLSPLLRKRVAASQPLYA